MAKAKSLDAKIDALSLVVETGFALMEKGFAAASEDIALRPAATAVGSLISTLLDEQLRPILRELRIIRVELDLVLERIAAIEKHLGINKKIAA